MSNWIKFVSHFYHLLYLNGIIYGMVKFSRHPYTLLPSNYVFKNISDSSYECLHYCALDCSCLACQVCDKDCQLFSVQVSQLPSSTKLQSDRCQYFEVDVFNNNEIVSQ